MERAAITERYRRVRAFTEELCSPLEVEDMVVQTMPDVSPTKWHLAHVTWFFETFVLSADAAYRPYHPAYAILFNSYYQSVGPQHARPERGFLSRPTVSEVMAYRAAVDAAVLQRLEAGSLEERALEILEIGLHHEEQHQELLLTDLKHVLGSHPLWPAYREAAVRTPGTDASELGWEQFEPGAVEVGHEGGRFAYDNESPRHTVFLAPFELANRPVTCGEYRAFLEDGGYAESGHWLSDGWNAVQSRGWEAPLYWRREDDGWRCFSLEGGGQPLDPAEPVCHLSYYEADAYARWAGARLPTEFEWEWAATSREVEGHFARDGHLHPVATAEGPGLQQLFGGVWEWTRSAYLPYPGYRAVDGALGEYNGKFMVSQQVLRGGSCATPSAEHLRPTYRNFFPPDARWQFSGLRLARDPA